MDAACPTPASRHAQERAPAVVVSMLLLQPPAV